MPTAVVAPEEENALLGALAGARDKLIVPILLGDAAKIRDVAASMRRRSLDGIAIEDLPSHDAAAARAVEMVHEGSATAVMKGNLHTDELLRHVVKSQGGLRIGRRISHVFVMDAPSLPELLLVTDAAINIAPTLEEKVDIVQNAIDLGIALGIAQPEGRHPVGGRDREPEDPVDARRGGAVEDERARPDPRRHRRWSAGDGQRDQPVGGQDQGAALARRRPRRHPGRAQSRIRQHPRQGADLCGAGARARGWCSAPRCRCC